jgi:hypothetical protein
MRPAERKDTADTAIPQEIPMRIITTAMVIGPLFLIGTLATAADLPAFSRASEHTIQLAASGEAPSDREGFVQKAHENTAKWQRKLQALNDKADANGKAAAISAEDDVHKAWSKVEATSQKLETASAEGWQDAKAAFETASRELADTWHKHYPADK